MIGLAKGGAALREDVRRRATSASENEAASIAEFGNLRRRWRHLPATVVVAFANRPDACTPAVWEGGSVNETAGPIRLQRAAEQPKQIAAASIFELLDYQEHGEFVSSSIDRALGQSNSPRGISYDCDTVD